MPPYQMSCKYSIAVCLNIVKSRDISFLDHLGWAEARLIWLGNDTGDYYRINKITKPLLLG
jgi:hypothetical protein